VPETTDRPAHASATWRGRLMLGLDLLVLLAAYLSQTPRALCLGGMAAPLMAAFAAVAPGMFAVLRPSQNGWKPAARSFRWLTCASDAASQVIFFFLLGSWLESAWRTGKWDDWILPSSQTPADLPSEFWAQFFSPRVFVWAFATLVVFGMLRNAEQARAEAASEAALRREAQDVAMRARLAPHFIFNALNTLKAQTELDPRAAGTTADRLAALLRQVLERADRPTVPLREELEFVEAYLGIERARLGDRLRVRLEVAEDVEGVEVPPMSLQALVENAVVHGIAPREAGGELFISAGWDGTGPFRKLRVRVENPVAHGARPGTGTGLRVLQGRLLRPEDLRTEQRDDRFLAEFIWRGVAA